MENTPAFHPLDYVSVLKRRLWWLVVPLVVAAVVGTALIAFLPREYRASATMGISLPALSSQALGQAQRVTTDERRRIISQTLMSDAVLERVVRDEGMANDGAVADAVQQVHSLPVVFAAVARTRVEVIANGNEQGRMRTARAQGRLGLFDQRGLAQVGQFLVVVVERATMLQLLFQRVLVPVVVGMVMWMIVIMRVIVRVAGRIGVHQPHCPGTIFKALDYPAARAPPLGA